MTDRLTRTARAIWPNVHRAGARYILNLGERVPCTMGMYSYRLPVVCVLLTLCSSVRMEGGMAGWLDDWAVGRLDGWADGRLERGGFGCRWPPRSSAAAVVVHGTRRPDVHVRKQP